MPIGCSSSIGGNQVVALTLLILTLATVSSSSSTLHSVSCSDLADFGVLCTLVEETWLGAKTNGSAGSIRSLTDWTDWTSSGFWCLDFLRRKKDCGLLGVSVVAGECLLRKK